MDALCNGADTDVSAAPTEEKSLLVIDSDLPSLEGFFSIKAACMAGACCINSFRRQNLTGGKESGKS